MLRLPDLPSTHLHTIRGLKSKSVSRDFGKEMFCRKISNQSRVILGAAALHLRTVVPGAKFQGLSHFEWKCWNICNDDPNMQRGPRIPAASQRLWQSSGRSPTVPHLPDGAVKAQKRQTPSSEDSRLPSRERLMALWWLR